MNIKRIARIGLAAFALTLATSTLTLTAPAPAAQAAPADDVTTACCTLNHWDVRVKFVGAAFRPTARGDGEDVAFQIENLGSTVNYPNIQLKAECNYRDWSTKAFTGTDTQPTQAMGMVQGSAPAPFLVTCPAKEYQIVSSVFLYSTTVGDANPKNDMAYWDSFSGGHSGS